MIAMPNASGGTYRIRSRSFPSIAEHCRLLGAMPDGYLCRLRADEDVIA